MSHNSKTMPAPTREFFERDPRAIELRDLTMLAVDASLELLGDGGQNDQARRQLEYADHQLRERGVKPGMHAVDPNDPERASKKRHLASDPVLTAEYVAGQMRETAEFARDPAARTPKTRAKLNKLSRMAIRGGLVDRATPEQVQWMQIDSRLGAIKHFVDYSAGPTRTH